MSGRKIKGLPFFDFQLSFITHFAAPAVQIHKILTNNLAVLEHIDICGSPLAGTFE
ncbi:MAG: hypothetical protein BWY71_02285 [Planctomycetes bacterium ADurb.Bin412]|nr:MAG: hypothetical protein BWY71_02285 [Planctomycetes bacterium ADurb.Bin412]